MISLTKLILEEKQKFEYGCAMLFFDFPELLNLQSKIAKEDLYTEEGSDRSYGLEEDPHITLLFGLHPEVTLKQVTGVLDKYTFTGCRVYKPSLFVNPKYDVLKFDIAYMARGGAFLDKINKDLKQFPYTSDFPDYHPHMTIAYLQPGTGKKYTAMFKDEEYELIPKKAVYSMASGEQHDIKINID